MLVKSSGKGERQGNRPDPSYQLHLSLQDLEGGDRNHVKKLVLW